MKALFDRTQAARVAQELSAWVKTSDPKIKWKKRPRTQVVSPSLCHDALERLAPSLEQHHGCDLIDINPGTCLWSRHLHHALQPRRHILVEPDRETFDQFITSLMNEFPDRFHHAETLSEALDASSGMLSEDVLNSHIAKPLVTNNPSLLLTVNLTGDTTAVRNYAGPNAGYFFNDFFTSFWGLRTNIHRYGLTRVLAWTPATYRRAIIPRAVDARSRSSISLEACASISEVASPGWSRSHDPYARENIWPGLLYEAASAVKSAEIEANIYSPEARRDTYPWAPPWAVPPEPDLIRSSLGTPDLDRAKEFLGLDAKLKIENPEWYAKARSKALSPSRRRIDGATPEQKRWRTLLTDRRDMYKNHVATTELVSKQIGLESRWRDSLAQSGETINAETLAQFDQEAKTNSHAINNLYKTFKLIARTAIDQNRAYYSRPQALAWNQRQFEPLLVQSNEFAPEQPLSLIDVTPLSRFREVLREDNQCQMFDRVIEVFGRALLNTDVHTALTVLLQAGVEEFVETCPSLKDHLQGGYYDLKDLRLRSLPIKLFFDITLAYEKWPFRPDMEYLVGSNRKTQWDSF